MAKTDTKRGSRTAMEAPATPLSPAAERECCYLEFLRRLMLHMQAAIRNHGAITKGASYYAGYEMTEVTESLVAKVAASHGFECVIDIGGMDAYSIRLRWKGDSHE